MSKRFQTMKGIKGATKAGDLVLVDSPDNKQCAPYNGRQGPIRRYMGDTFIVVKIDGKDTRFRPGELKVL